MGMDLRLVDGASYGRKAAEPSESSLLGASFLLLPKFHVLLIHDRFSDRTPIRQRQGEEGWIIHVPQGKKKKRQKHLLALLKENVLFFFLLRNYN